MPKQDTNSTHEKPLSDPPVSNVVETGSGEPIEAVWKRMEEWEKNNPPKEVSPEIEQLVRDLM
jgi:hypothetical protein